MSGGVLRLHRNLTGQRRDCGDRRDGRDRRHRDALADDDLVRLILRRPTQIGGSLALCPGEVAKLVARRPAFRRHVGARGPRRLGGLVRLVGGLGLLLQRHGRVHSTSPPDRGRPASATMRM
jgi:hypothetical protein